MNIWSKVRAVLKVVIDIAVFVRKQGWAQKKPEPWDKK